MRFQSGLAFSGLLLTCAAFDPLVCVAATSASASVSVEIAAPAEVLADAAAQMLYSGSDGVLSLRIPGSSGGAGAATTLELVASSAVALDGTMVFSATDAGGLAQLIDQLIISGSSFTTNGLLSGRGVQIVVVKATQGSDGFGTVIAIVTYN